VLGADITVATVAVAEVIGAGSEGYGSVTAQVLRKVTSLSRWGCKSEAVLRSVPSVGGDSTESDGSGASFCGCGERNAFLGQKVGDAEMCRSSVRRNPWGFRRT